METELWSERDETGGLDSELLDAVVDLQAGRSVETSFRRVFEAFYPKIHRYFFSRGFTWEDAEDLSQDVFLEVFERIEALRRPEELRSWLFGLAAYRRLEVLRESWRRRQRQVEAVERCQLDSGRGGLWVHGGRPQLKPDTGLYVAAKRLRVLGEMRAAWSAMADLAPQMRRCFQFRLQGMKYLEIAEALGISVGAVKFHLAEASRRLRQEVAGFRSSQTRRSQGSRVVT